MRGLAAASPREGGDYFFFGKRPPQFPKMMNMGRAFPKMGLFGENFSERADFYSLEVPLMTIQTEILSVAYEAGLGDLGTPRLIF